MSELFHDLAVDEAERKVKRDPVHELRVGLEDAAVFLGILAATYRAAGDDGMAKLATAARNKATAALERAGFPFQEDPANQGKMP